MACMCAMSWIWRLEPAKECRLLASNLSPGSTEQWLTFSPCELCAPSRSWGSFVAVPSFLAWSWPHQNLEASVEPASIHVFSIVLGLRLQARTFNRSRFASWCLILSSALKFRYPLCLVLAFCWHRLLGPLRGTRVSASIAELGPVTSPRIRTWIVRTRPSFLDFYVDGSSCVEPWVRTFWILGLGPCKNNQELATMMCYYRPLTSEFFSNIRSS